MANASAEKGNSGELAFGYAIFALVLFVVFIGLFAGLPALTESKVTGPLMVIFIVCLVMGAEGKGLSRLVRERCDAVASIPLMGDLASLNVSAAGALACYEVTRRRLAAKNVD